MEKETYADGDGAVTERATAGLLVNVRLAGAAMVEWRRSVEGARDTMERKMLTSHRRG